MNLNRWQPISVTLLLLLFSSSPSESANNSPDCVIEFTKLPQEMDIGKEYEIIMRLVNKGADSLKDKGAFSGMHVEIENAHVKNVLAYSPFSGARETDVRQEKGIKWFEAAYNNLRAGESGSVSFNIIPSKLPVRIYYRAWIPAEVPLEERDEAVSGLSDKYKKTGYWRDERYLRRAPKNNDPLSPFCKVKVQAARKEKIDYRCFVMEISSQNGIPLLNSETKKYLLALARNNIETAVTPEKPRALDPLSEDRIKYLKKQTNTVYVTIYKDGKVIGCYGSKKGDIIDNTLEASRKILQDSRFLPFVDPENPEELDNAMITINILGTEQKLTEHDIKSITREIALGIDGVRIQKNKFSAFYKSCVAVTSRMDHEELLGSLCIKAGIDQSSWTEKSTRIYKVPSIEFIEAKNSDGYLDLTRAAPYVSLDEVTRINCENAVESGAEWLTANQLPEGLYSYMYYPSSDHYSPDNNIIRQAGAAYSLAVIGKKTHNTSYTLSSKRVIDNILTKLKYADKEEQIPYLYGAEQKQGTLGGTALFLLAMTELENHEEYKTIMRKLVDSILSMQDAGGEFTTSFVSKNGPKDFNISPAQAILALSRYYQLVEKDPRCLDAVSKAFTCYSNYWREKKTADFTRWHIQAWSEAYFLTKQKLYAKFVFAMSDWLLITADCLYSPGSSPYPDYLGGIIPEKQMPNFLTASYLEGISSSFLVARSMNDNERAEKYGYSMALAARFVLNLQFKDNNMHYIRNKPRTKGAFRLSLTDNSLRCDFTRHSIMALHRILTCFSDEDFKKFTGE